MKTQVIFANTGRSLMILMSRMTVLLAMGIAAVAMAVDVAVVPASATAEAGSLVNDAAPQRQLSRTEIIHFVTNPEGVVYTEWAEFGVDQGYWAELKEVKMSVVCTEGRLHEGRMQYRKGYRNFAKAFPDARKYLSYSHKGMSHQRFIQRNHELFLQGYALVYTQVCMDASNLPRYQALWVLMPDH